MALLERRDALHLLVVHRVVQYGTQHPTPDFLLCCLALLSDLHRLSPTLLQIQVTLLLLCYRLMRLLLLLMSSGRKIDSQLSADVASQICELKLRK